MSVGPLQILVILVLVLILFGAGRLPNVMGDVAKGIKNFRAALKEDGSESKDASQEKREISSRPENEKPPEGKAEG